MGQLANGGVAVAGLAAQVEGTPVAGMDIGSARGAGIRAGGRGNGLFRGNRQGSPAALRLELGHLAVELSQGLVPCQAICGEAVLALKNADVLAGLLAVFAVHANGMPQGLQSQLQGFHLLALDPGAQGFVALGLGRDKQGKTQQACHDNKGQTLCSLHFNHLWA